MDAAVAIYQFLPNPTNEDEEWIELKNNTSDTINLSGFYLDDEPDGGSKPYKIPDGKEIGPNAVLKFPKSETKIALNNSKQKDQPFADSVRLLNRESQQLDIITYTNTHTDEVISHTTPSPVPPTQAPVPTIKPTVIISPSPTTVPVKVLSVKTESISVATSPTPKPSSTPSSTPLPTPTPSVLPISAKSSTKPSWPGFLSFVIGLGLLGFSAFRFTAKLRE